jgi:hypothetical protein
MAFRGTPNSRGNLKTISPNSEDRNSKSPGNKPKKNVSRDRSKIGADSILSKRHKVRNGRFAAPAIPEEIWKKTQPSLKNKIQKTPETNPKKILSQLLRINFEQRRKKEQKKRSPGIGPKLAQIPFWASTTNDKTGVSRHPQFPRKSEKNLSQVWRIKFKKPRKKPPKKKVSRDRSKIDSHCMPRNHQRR